MKKSIGTLITEVMLLIGILFLVALGIWFLSKSRTEQPPPYRNTAPLVYDYSTLLRGIQPAFSTFDIDSDGLPDWEEALWGTDPEKPDTDSDGTPDGAEVVAHRNPRKGGPNDSLETPVMVLQSPLEKGVSESARTGVVTPLLKGVPPSSAGRVVPLLTQETTTPTTPASADGGTPFSKGDTTTPQVPSLETEGREQAQAENPLHSFGNALGAPIQTAATDSDAELAFWNSASGNTKMTEALLQGFGKLAKKYDQIALDIAAVVSPEKASSVHSALVRAYQNYARSIQTISGTKAGAYLSGPDITEYSESSLALAKAFVAVSDFLYNEGVGFSQGEPGSIFSFPR